MKKLFILYFIFLIPLSAFCQKISLSGGGSSGAVEGTAVLSTGEAGGTKFLREDSDGTCSWQSIPGSGGDLLADGSVPMTANWEFGNYDLTLKAITGDGAATFPIFATVSDPADQGAIRLSNGSIIAWEDGTETTLTHVDNVGLSLNTKFTAGTMNSTGNFQTNANILSPNALTIYTTGASDDIIIDANSGGAADIAIGVSGDSDTIHLYGAVTADANIEAATLTEGGVAVYNDDEMDSFAELDAIVTDKALVNKTDGAVITGAWDLNAATFEPPNSAADVALADAGKMHLNTTDEQLSFHSAADGEISGEASISLLGHFSVSFDPDAVCDLDHDIYPLGVIGDDFPEGIIIDEWKVSFMQDPTTEADLDLKYADAYIGLANAAVIDVLDTTSGAATEDTDGNINGGAAVANSKVMYLSFGTAYTATGELITFDMWYHGEED